MTDAQRRGFDQFFRSVRTLKVTFALAGLDVSGAAADGRLDGAYDYVTMAGKAEHQPVRFHATFAREGTAVRNRPVR